MVNKTDFSELLEQLKPSVNSPDFAQRLAQLTPEFSNTQRFLLKMELTRLAKPCTRIIDHRSKSTEQTKEYAYHGISHYISDDTISIFEHQVRLFGSYTLGVYEAVEDFIQTRKESIDNARMAEQDTTNKATAVTSCAPVVVFDDYVRRSEERMNFSIELEIVTGSQNGLKAVSLDISQNGLRIKVSNDHSLPLEEKIFVIFKGLEKEYKLDVDDGVLFKVVDIERFDDHQRIALLRIANGDSKGFDEFLEKFINGNKRRYKVNVDNTIHALKVKAFEQYYIPYFTSVPIYIATEQQQYIPKYVLTNNNNRTTLGFWHDEERWLKIEGLLPHTRLARYLQKNQPPTATTVFCFSFNHKQKTFFYSATLEELNDQPELKQIFLGYGAKRLSWRVYRLQFSTMSASQAYKPLSIPDSVGPQVAQLNAPPAARLMSKLKNLSHIALITDITDEHATTPYQTYKVERSSAQKIQKFLHPRTPEQPPLELYRFKYHDLRNEQRFHYRTTVKLQINNSVVSGTTEDISVTGLRVQLDRAVKIRPRTTVLIDLPELQQFTKKVKLQNLPYKVMNVSGNGLAIHLRGFTDYGDSDEKPSSISQRFFSAFIKEFDGELTSLAEQEEIPKFGEALRNIYASNNLNLPVFFTRDGIYIKPVAVGKPRLNPRLVKLFEADNDNNEYDVQPLYLNHKKSDSTLNDVIKSLANQQAPKMLEALISRQAKAGKIVTDCRFTHQFDDPSEIEKFVAKARRQGEFVGIKLFISKTGKADIDLLQTELKYINVYASHKASELEQELWAVTALADIVDITDEVLTRYQLP